MKSSSAVFRALSIALLAAVVLYFGVQGCRYLTDPYSTTLAYRSICCSVPDGPCSGTSSRTSQPVRLMLSSEELR